MKSLISQMFIIKHLLFESPAGNSFTCVFVVPFFVGFFYFVKPNTRNFDTESTGIC